MSFALRNFVTSLEQTRTKRTISLGNIVLHMFSSVTTKLSLTQLSFSVVKSQNSPELHLKNESQLWLLSVPTLRNLKLKHSELIFIQKGLKIRRLYADRSGGFFQQKRSRGKAETQRAPQYSCDTLGKSTQTPYLISLFLTPPTHSQTRECSWGEVGVGVGGVLWRESESTGHTFKRPLSAVKRVDGDERW